MTVDYKNAKHICNVIRRQIQNSFPDLYIEFIIHGENEREKIFLKSINSLENHPASNYLIRYVQSNKCLKENKSHFIALAHHNQPGFLGFFKNSNYLALCFINHNYFNNDNELRNHAIHIAWHAINLYELSKNEKEDYNFKNHILTPNFPNDKKYHNNLLADIFSASLQEIQSRENALKTLTTQRIKDTITPKKGFIAEDFPFPICIDTLEFILKNDLDQYKKGKKPVISALKITENIGKTYKPSTMEQWRIFSIPAQEMAWLNFTPETILGAALYTSESIYAQSIADIIAERLEIKPDTISSFNDYNPFANIKTNEIIHKKQCEKLINKLLNQIESHNDYKNLLDIAKKQNESLLEKPIIGWCANGLIQASNIIKDSPSENITEELLNQAKEAFSAEINSIKWDTLMYFSRMKCQSQRNYSQLKMSNLIKIAEEHDEFFSIYQTLIFTKNIETIEIEQKQTKSDNITQFISENAIKK